MVPCVVCRILHWQKRYRIIFSAFSCTQCCASYFCMISCILVSPALPCCSCLLPEAWRGTTEETENLNELASGGVYGLFGGNGQQLGRRYTGTIAEVGYRIVNQVLSLTDCFRVPQRVASARGSDGEFSAALPYILPCRFAGYDYLSEGLDFPCS